MITRYVNTASSAGGDGTTNATSGANRAYASLNEAEAAEQCLLTDSIEFICEGVAADTTVVSFAGWTGISETNYILVRTTSANRHDGKWNTSKYRLSVGDARALALYQSIDIKFRGLQVEIDTASGNNYCIMGSGDSYDLEVDVDKCILRNVGAAGGGRGISLDRSTGSSHLTVMNSVIEDLGTGIYLGSNSAWTSGIYNSTITGGYYYGIWSRHASNTVTVKNCAVFNNTDDFSGTFTSVTHCASDDGDGTSAVHWTGGSTDWANVFTDYANGDFHLNNFSGTGAVIGQGTDDPGSGLYSDDIDGDTRSSTWDIGADEYVAAGGTTYYQTVTGAMPNTTGIVVSDAVFDCILAGNLPEVTGVVIKLTALDLLGVVPAPSGTITKDIETDLFGVVPSATADMVATSLYKQSVMGDVPATTGVVASEMIVNQGVAGVFGAITGGIKKVIGKVVAGIVPSPEGVDIKRIDKSVVGEIPAPSGSTGKETSVSLTGTMGSIVGIVGTVLNPVVESAMGLCRLIGSCFRKLLG